jgi:hypothetical protein
MEADFIRDKNTNWSTQLGSGEAKYAAKDQLSACRFLSFLKAKRNEIPQCVLG